MKKDEIKIDTKDVPKDAVDDHGKITQKGKEFLEEDIFGEIDVDKRTHHELVQCPDCKTIYDIFEQKPQLYIRLVKYERMIKLMNRILGL